MVPASLCGMRLFRPRSAKKWGGQLRWQGPIETLRRMEKLGQRSAVELLSAGIEALICADAAQLERLSRAARNARGPETAEERRVTREQLRTMAILIPLAARNLRLLRGSGCSGYGPLRD